MIRQTFHLLILMGAHVTADLLGGMLGAILPAICLHFNLSLSMGLALITALGMTANIFQVVGGHFHSGVRPWAISVGLCLACLIPLIGWFPAGYPHVSILAALLMAGGVGVAWVHPNGLRGIHTLHRIPSSVSTAVFMVGGFAGFASGAWIAGAIVEQIGLRGLIWLIPLGLGMALIVPLSGVRLSTDEAAPAPSASNEGIPRLAFPHLMVMGTLVALAAFLLTSLLPTYLHQLGFPLNIGGRTVFVFGLGGAVGSLFWGAVAHRRGYGLALRGSLGPGIPLLIAYLLLARFDWAFWLLLLASFFLYAAFPLIVTLARYSVSNMTLGRRMGLIVGGCWGIASLILMGLGPVGERIGLSPILHLSWLCYLAVFGYSLFTLSTRR